MRYKSHEIQQHITSQRTSGLSARAYCRTHDLSYWTFVQWRKKDHVAAADISIPFVKINMPQACGFVELAMPSGVTIRFPVDAAFEPLRQLLGAIKLSGIV